MGLPARRTSVWLGIARLARFRADGLEQFGHTPQAFLNSLAPLLAFPLVSGAMTMVGTTTGSAPCSRSSAATLPACSPARVTSTRFPESGPIARY